ncbi:MAG: AsnC family transcriptional regulator [Deltaproteobacteria bacterium]|nr:AsnC family transcriptional regulator [Deltaproteobacteria bacterium]RLB90446.1 MAG: Lrp/AsnC family transcriptional regulator [Deltaproteobacteria bacterium]RLB95304.1 MAG: Lrp/AsnC family transcriptional regulator [Deltaproteobacteria bacterium]RLC12341.1 MAG: Lrp/AsnC family transcriptional regulator [Deltaproteobacteria bacterium]
MDDTDRAILNRIQSNFPITSRPYLEVAEELSLGENDVIDRVRHLRKTGIIRRIGANFAPGRLGFISTLCAARVAKDEVALFTEVVNRYPGVTHNYRRDHEFNIWFTFIAETMEQIEAYLEEIIQETGVKEILNLPATKVYKINAQFDL